MQIKKKSETFNDYTLNCSYGELEALKDALAKNHTGPIADTLYAGLLWELERLPKPGEEEDKKGEGEGADDMPSPLKAEKPEAPKPPAERPAPPALKPGPQDLESDQADEFTMADLDRELPPAPESRPSRSLPARPSLHPSPGPARMRPEL